MTSTDTTARDTHASAVSASVRDLTHAVMRYYGYTDTDIADAEAVHPGTVCGEDCWNEDGELAHPPAYVDLGRTAAVLVDVVLPQLSAPPADAEAQVDTLAAELFAKVDLREGRSSSADVARAVIASDWLAVQRLHTLTGEAPGTPEQVLCRTCLRPITFEARTEPGYLPREGWYDDARVDALVCFKAADYGHVPLTGRELAYYEAGYRAATTRTTAQAGA